MLIFCFLWNFILRLTDVGQLSHKCGTSVSLLWDSCLTSVSLKICLGKL